MKVLIYGLPKSGTTILKARIQKAMAENGIKDMSVIMEPMSREDNGQTIFKNYAGEEILQNENSLTKALMSVNEPFGVDYKSIHQMFSDYDKKIFIIRDPRDRVISQILYRWFKANEDLAPTYSDTLARLKFKESNPSALPFFNLFSVHHHKLLNWKKTLSKFSEALEEFKETLDDNWLVYHYEDCVNGNYQKLSNFLGFQVTDEAAQSKGLVRVSRTNTSENWRNWFTQEDVEFFKGHFNKILKVYGYNEVDWRLNNPASLPSEEGSEYIAKLFNGQSQSLGMVEKIKKLFTS